METRQSTDKRIDKKSDRPDLQTANLFLILAVLTGLFVLGLKWALLTPNAATSAANGPVNVPPVESAGK